MKPIKNNRLRDIFVSPAELIWCLPHADVLFTYVTGDYIHRGHRNFERKYVLLPPRLVAQNPKKQNCNLQLQG